MFEPSYLLGTAHHLSPAVGFSSWARDSKLSAKRRNHADSVIPTEVEKSLDIKNRELEMSRLRSTWHRPRPGHRSGQHHRVGRDHGMVHYSSNVSHGFLLSSNAARPQVAADAAASPHFAAEALS